MAPPCAMCFCSRRNDLSFSVLNGHISEDAHVRHDDDPASPWRCEHIDPHPVQNGIEAPRRLPAIRTNAFPGSSVAKRIVGFLGAYLHHGSAPCSLLPLLQE